MDFKNKKLLIGAICVIIIIVAFIMYRRKEYFSGYVQTSSDGSEKIILYYSPNCGHCKAMSGTWATFQDYINNNPNGVITEKINCLENKCDVKGFPTIKFIKKNGVVIEFDGERTVDAFKQFVETNRSK